MTKILPIACLVSVTALAACSTSNTESVVFDSADALALSNRASAATDATEADLPSSATMSGYIVASIDDGEADEVFAGTMDVTADFETGDMSGTASDLASYELEGVCETIGDDCAATLLGEFDGELALDATITGVEFAGDLTGTVTNDFEDDLRGTLASSIDVDLEVDGAFGTDAGGLLAAANIEGSADQTLTDAEGAFVEEISYDIDGAFLVAE